MKGEDGVKKLFAIIFSCFLLGSVFQISSASASTLSTKPSSAKVTIVNKQLGENKITYPQVKNTSNSTSIKKINTSLRNKATKINNEVTKFLIEEQKNKDEWNNDLGPFIPWEWKSTYEVKYNNHGKLSIAYYDYTFTGGAHGMTAVSTDNYDVVTGKKVNLSSIIVSNSVAKVQQFVYKQLQKKYSPLLIDSYEKINLGKERTWVFSSNGVKLIFGQYEVGPYSIGITEITVSSKFYQ